MDDGRVTNAMTLEGISSQLKTVVEQVDTLAKAVDSGMRSMESRMGSMESRMGSMDSRMDTMQKEMKDGFAHVDQKLNEARMRDEELRGLMTFGLEAREALRETMEERFTEADKKHDEQIDLLKTVLRGVTK